LERRVETLRADYLIVGSGACGMAFLDVLISHSDVTAVVVDRHNGPGGHWNDAYPFVRLHQPSAYYGVCSKALGRDNLDPDPLNQGMLERASAEELLAYYQELMAEYVATGRVTYLPSCDYLGHGVVRPLGEGQSVTIEVTRKIVDTTFLQTAVPSTHPPCYQIGEDVTCITPNQLALLPSRDGHFTIVGAGKTGVDVCLWLLENGTAPDAIRWIMPRDCWFQNRANVQRGDSYFETTYTALAKQMEIAGNAKTVDDAIQALGENDILLRLDPEVTPTLYHGAIMSEAELTNLRQIKDVVRLGRITAISDTKIVFVDGTLAAAPNTIYIDCSATGVTKRDAIAVFSDTVITLQMVRPVQPVFSAALIAFVETLDLTEADKNQLTTPVTTPDAPRDSLVMLVEGATNQARWGQNIALRAWINTTRLDTFSMMARRVREDETDKRALLKRVSSQIGPALMNVRQLLRA
jgi:hypothetical protein